jgi:hypothetical protein
MTETARLEGLLEKYKFILPVPAAMRKRLLKSRARVLKSTLKELDDYSIWYAIVLIILLKARSYGFKFSFAVAKIFATTALIIASGVVISGAYAAVQYYKPYFDSIFIEKKNEVVESANGFIEDENSTPIENIQETASKLKQENAPAYEIFLYNGKKYHGIIQSRGKSYIVSTSKGQVTIPATQIKMIKRAKQ